MNLPDLPYSPFSELIGIEDLEATPERGVSALTLEEKHANALGIAHGGAIFALADRAYGIADNLTPEPFVAMEMHVRYLRPALIGQRIVATAKRRHQGRQSAFYQIDVRDERDRLIACITGTAHLLSKPTESSD